MNQLKMLNKDICSCKQKIWMLCCRCKSYYSALGLNSSASAKDIKTAYYKLSLECHPDKNKGSEESTAKFREITEAYETLSNPAKKKKYDLECNLSPEYSRYKTREFKSQKSNGPFTGRTRDFDYDEHFRQHYEYIKKQREAEFEYFKRRWEADYSRRYPFKDDYFKNRGKPIFETPEEFSKRMHDKKRSFIALAAVWTFLVLLACINEWNNPDRPLTYIQPIYYNTSSKNQNSSEKHSERE